MSSHFEVHFDEAACGGTAARRAFTWNGSADDALAAATAASVDMDALWRALTLSHPCLDVRKPPHLAGMRPGATSESRARKGERSWEVDTAMARAIEICPEEPAPRLSRAEATSLLRDLMLCEPTTRAEIAAGRSPEIALKRSTEALGTEMMSYHVETASLMGTAAFETDASPAVLATGLLILARTERAETDAGEAQWQDGRRARIRARIECPASAVMRAALRATIERDSRKASERVGAFLARLGERELASQIAAIAGLRS